MLVERIIFHLSFDIFHLPLKPAQYSLSKGRWNKEVK